MTLVTDLSTFDLEPVFSSLDSKDLINLADANMYLRNEVRDYLKKHFAKTMILLGSPSTDIGFFDNILFHFRGLKFVLQFLRIFGDQLKILYFAYINTERKTLHVGSYVNIYCCNLEILIFRLMTLNLTLVFKNVFNVKILFFEYGHPDVCLSSILKIFPNLEKLILFQVKIKHSKNFIKSYCSLKLLIVDNYSLKFINIELLKKLNPDLQVVIIHEWCEYLIHKQCILDEWNENRDN